nr:hypothetical protein BCU45_11965 [Vibrio lentus]
MYLDVLLLKCREMTKEEVAERCFKAVRIARVGMRPQPILAEIALLGIQSELEIKTSTHLLGLARAIASIKK